MLENHSLSSLSMWRWDVLAATAILNLLVVLMSFLIVQFFDHLAVAPISTTGLLLGGVLVIFVFDIIIRQARARILSWLKLRRLYRISTISFEHLVNPHTAALKHLSAGAHLHLMESISSNKTFANSQEYLALLDIPFVLLFMGLIGFLSPVMVVIPVGVLCTLGTVGIYQGSKVKKLLVNRHTLDTQRSDFMVQVLKNYPTIKTLGMENLLLRRYEKLQFQDAFFADKLIQLHAMMRDLAPILCYIMLIANLSIGAHRVVQGNLSMSLTSVCIFLTGLIMQPLQSIFRHCCTIKQAQQINKKFDQSIQDYQPDGKSGALQAELTGLIRLENIEFTYTEAQRLILSNLNLSVQPNTIVTIFGPNGAGKTTLARLIMRNLEPQQGKITFNGHDIKELSYNSLSRQVMYVGANIQLFAGTILENLTMFRVGPLIEEAIKLARELGLESWIESHTLSYQTRLHDEVLLSIPDGIKQRIGLIRALLAEPKILILDEANETLDDQGDTQLRKVLLALKEVSTIIFITHRPSMKQIADESYDLVKGSLVPSLNVNPIVKNHSLRPTKAIGGLI